MGTFEGFPPGKSLHTLIPEAFFQDLLAEIDHLGELKVTLYFFWRLNRMEGRFRFLWHSDIESDQALLSGLEADPKKASRLLDESLTRMADRGTILPYRVKSDRREEQVYFLNSARGRAALQACEAGQWQPAKAPTQAPPPQASRPNIYQLYEENIGPLSPIISDALAEAEDEYPEAWIAEAIQIAVENNVRRWRYIEAILRSWKDEGKDEGRIRGDSEEDRRRYIRGQYSEFIEH